VLQAILPALKAQAERISRDSDRRDEVWELLLFYAWEAICNYPLCRRLRVAANLVLQVLHDTTRELYRPHNQHEEEPFAHDDLDELLTRAGFEHLDGPALRSAEVPVMSAVAARVIGKRDAELILQSRVDAVPLRRLARTSGASYHALRQRRQRAEARLRTLLDAKRNVSKAPLLDLTSSGGTFSSPPRARDVDRSRQPLAAKCARRRAA
jgi:hypothetical protein